MKAKTFLMLVMLLAAALLPAEGALSPKYVNEWMFDQDAVGEFLSGAQNTGTEGAVFSADMAGITQTDGIRHLVCSNDVSDVIGLYENGAVLTAAVNPPVAGRVLYLRYDLEYDLSSAARDAGTLLGLGFTDGTTTNLAGVALKYDTFSDNSAPPPGVVEITVPGVRLELSGSLSVIAGVDLINQEMSVWYDLSGGNTFSAEPDIVASNLNLAGIQDLVFRATGDLLHTASNECVQIDNIRTADSWAEISAPVVDLTAAPELTVSLISGSGESMAVGQSNLISVVISNQNGIASNVVSQLSHDGGGGLSIISSNNPPVLLGGGRSVTQTFSVVANEVGVYSLAANATADGGVFVVSASLPLLVGKRISFDSYSIANESGGTLPGQIEPGEVLDLIVTSINDGGGSVSGITNSLSPVNPAYFTVLSNVTSQVYGVVESGETTSTVYRVACSANGPNGPQPFMLINRTADLVWTNYFDVNVFRQAVLTLSQSNLTISVGPGSTASASVVLSNEGNAGTPFSVSFDGRQPGTYRVEPQAEPRFTFALAEISSDTVFSSWSGTDTDLMDIGFVFPLSGIACDRFSVSQNGYLTVWSGSNSARISPFETSESPVDLSTVRFQKLNDRLIVAWNNGGDLEFQVWLHKDGSLQFLYQSGTWGEGSISVDGQAISYTPGWPGNDGLLLTLQSWVTYSPLSGFLSGAGGARELVVCAAVPEDRAGGTNVFTVTVAGEGTSAIMDVTVVVEKEVVQLDVPVSFEFSGPAGFISPAAVLSVTNNGNVPLSYVITDSGLQTASFTSSSVPYQWVEIPWAADYMIDSSELDTQSMDIGFPFVFFGRTYTGLVVGVDGTLMLGGLTDRAVISFSGDLTLDDNSSIRMLTDVGLTHCVVTWENVRQPGGGDDQSFQTVLYRDGSIQFNYRQLSGSWPAAILKLTNDTVTVWGSLSNSSTVVTTTNIVPVMETQTNWIGNAFTVEEVQTGALTNILTEYVDTVNRQSFQFSMGRQRIISFTPAEGSITAGGTALIELRGDARSLSAGGAEDVAESTTLAFVYDESSADVNVTFTATNSIETAYSSEVVRAAWGVEEVPVVHAELNEDGSRTLSWPAARDGLSRKYNILFTTSLGESWTLLATVQNAESFVDAEYSAEPVMFYKVTVE